MHSRNTWVSLLLMVLIGGCQTAASVKTPQFAVVINPHCAVEGCLVLTARDGLFAVAEVVHVKRGTLKAMAVDVRLSNHTQHDLFVLEFTKPWYALQWLCRSHYPDGDECLEAGMDGRVTRFAEPVLFRRLHAWPREEQRVITDRPVFLDFHTEIPLPVDQRVESSHVEVRFPLWYFAAKSTEPAVVWITRCVRIVYED